VIAAATISTARLRKLQSRRPVQGYLFKYSADFAIKYWATDLQSLANLVPVNAKDDATWQHLVTFGIGLD